MKMQIFNKRGTQHKRSLNIREKFKTIEPVLGSADATLLNFEATKNKGDRVGKR